MKSKAYKLKCKDIPTASSEDLEELLLTIDGKGRAFKKEVLEELYKRVALIAGLKALKPIEDCLGITYDTDEK